MKVCEKLLISDNVLNQQNNIEEVPPNNNLPPLDEEDILFDWNVPPENETQSELTKSLALLMLNLKAKHNISNAAIDSMCLGLQNILPIAAVESESIEESIHQLSNQKRRESYYKKNLGLKQPEELYVETVEVMRKRKSGETLPKQIADTYHCTPLRWIFSALFSNARFRQIYLSETGIGDGSVKSHRDTKHYANHPLFGVPHRFPPIRLQFSFDENDVVNPLGSKTKSHEVGMFNFQVLNIPPEMNSLLANIFTYAVVKSKHLKKFGFDFVLDPLMDEIKI